MEGGEKTEMDLRWRRGKSRRGGGGGGKERVRGRIGDRQNYRQTDGGVRKLRVERTRDFSKTQDVKRQRELIGKVDVTVSKRKNRQGR